LNFARLPPVRATVSQRAHSGEGMRANSMQPDPTHSARAERLDQHVDERFHTRSLL